MKNAETKWKDHLTSENHLECCTNVDNSIALKFFKMIFEAGPEKKKIYNIKKEKTRGFWRLYFLTKLPKEKFDIMCNDSIDRLEFEKKIL